MTQATRRRHRAPTAVLAILAAVVTVLAVLPVGGRAEARGDGRPFDAAFVARSAAVARFAVVAHPTPALRPARAGLFLAVAGPARAAHLLAVAGPVRIVTLSRPAGIRPGAGEPVTGHASRWSHTSQPGPDIAAPTIVLRLEDRLTGGTPAATAPTHARPVAVRGDRGPPTG